MIVLGGPIGVSLQQLLHSTTTVEVPVIGETALEEAPLVLSTVFFGLVDGINPCSLWVLSVLLGLVMYTNRRHVLLVGLTFLTVTAAVYGLFVAGALRVMTYVAHLSVIRWLVAAFAVVFAAVSIKDFVWYNRGPSLTIPDRAKPSIYKRTRRLLHVEGPLSTIAGTAVLAAGVALVELPCTAGFPVVWSNLIAAHELANLQYLSLLATYLLAYLSVEVGLFVIAVTTMSTLEFDTIHGRALKLVGGAIMLALAGALVVYPTILHDTVATTALFLGATAASGFVILLTRLCRRHTDAVVPE